MEDIDKLEELASNIKATALCGLGQTAPNPVLSTLQVFPGRVRSAHRREKRCPAGVCKSLLNYEIDPDEVQGLHACAHATARPAPSPAP